MVARGVVEHRHLGDDDRVAAELGRAVDRAVPLRQPHAVGVGVERQVHLGVARMRVGHAGAQFRVGEIQAGKRARVGLVLEAGVDRIGAVVDCGLQGRQVAGGTHQLHRDWPREGAEVSPASTLPALIQVSPRRH